MDCELQKIIEIAAVEFGTHPSALSFSSTPEDVDAWDSEAQLRLAMAVEEQFGISFDIEEFQSICSLGSLAEMVVRKRNLQSS